MADIPVVRWGIVGSGMISSWFVGDIITDRSDAKVKHVIQAIGASSSDKGQEFTRQICPDHPSKVYDSYAGVYNDPEVDVVYIGTPHGLHYNHCMQAIEAGKNVLCEKAFMLNAHQAKEVFEAAKKKNVYVAEAMWLRHRPLVLDLCRLLHQEKVIGDILRASADFASGVDIASLPPTSRYLDLNLGAGSLLDIGVYSLTWVVLALDDKRVPKNPPQVKAFQTHEKGIEITTTAILQYDSGQQGIAKSTTKTLAPPGEVFAVIEGTDGFVEIQGRTSSAPESFTVYKKQEGGNPDRCLWEREKFQSQQYEFPHTGRGFVYEADNTALDILSQRKESQIMPWSETLLMMEIMDEIRRQGGTRYPGELSL